jgi:Cof subfamily protein (haloacid dehalogenase superfamily)
MVKMIVMDLDGTLLTKEKTISNYTLSILEKCKTKEVKIVIATARSEKSAKRCIDLVKLHIVILNGGVLVKDKKKIIYKKTLSIETSDGIIKECIENKNVGDITVETDTGYYVSYSDPAYHLDYIHGKYYDFSKPLSQETYKIVAEIIDRKIALDIERKFTECKLTSFAGENWHRFAHKEAEKMIAIEKITQEEKLTISDVVAFGDDYNDLEMIQKMRNRSCNKK